MGRGRRGGAGWGAPPLRGQGATLGADPGGTERRRRGTLHIDPVTVGNIFVHAVALRAASGCVGGRRAHAGEGGEGEGSEGEGGAAGAGTIVLSGLGAVVRRSGARLTVSYQAWYVSGVHIEGNSSKLDMPAVSSMQKKYRAQGPGFPRVVRKQVKGASLPQCCRPSEARYCESVCVCSSD